MRLDVQDQLALCARLERFCCHGKWKDCDGAAASIGRGLQHSGRFPGLKPVMRRFEVINSCGNKARMAKLAFPQDAVDKGSDAYVRRAMPALESLACNFSARLSTALLNIDCNASVGWAWGLSVSAAHT